MSILKRLVDLLAPLGFVIAVGAVASARAGVSVPGGLRPWLIAAAALVLVHLILRWEDATRGLGRRQMKYGTNTLVLKLDDIHHWGGIFRRPFLYAPAAK